MLGLKSFSGMDAGKNLFIPAGHGQGVPNQPAQPGHIHCRGVLVYQV